jgi:hypothetical protein
MSNSHVIDYLVITAADVTAIFFAWLAGKGWIDKTARRISRINWEQSGHLYWLSSDLMWTWMQADAGNITKVNHGLRKALHHANSLKIGDPVLSHLKALQVANAEKQSLASSEKTALIRELEEIIDQVGKLAEGNQGDFAADPKP